MPPFARAAMDGYAVVAEDTSGASRTSRRRSRASSRCSPARCRRARSRAGAVHRNRHRRTDARRRRRRRDGRGDRADGAATVAIFAPAYPRQNVGRQGADIARGQTVLRAGELLNPSRVGALAALGITDVDVFAQPRVAILSTGNEIVEPGPAARARARSTTSTASRCARSSPSTAASPVPHQTAQRHARRLWTRVDACLASDVLVFSGGSSVGERDLILDVLGRRGEVLFHGIAVKPGKPTAFGIVSGKPVFGMPGYPTSCLSNAYMLLVPALRRMARLPPHRRARRTAPLGPRIVSTTGRHQFYTVRIVDGVAMPAFKASGDITSMSHADGYIEIPAQTDIVERRRVVEVKSVLTAGCRSQADGRFEQRERQTWPAKTSAPRHRRAYPVMTPRGCPCGATLSLRRPRVNEPSSVAMGALRPE